MFSHLHENGFNIKRDKIKDDEDRLEVKLKTKTGKEINQEIEKYTKIPSTNRKTSLWNRFVDEMFDG
ncbi:MAG: hypothetical protein HWD59_15275 [Coxiellaceae bacterium]|nr:MAG: hypothetical protein HWD59_15275 [Coxiellaceae bacterium]